MPSILTLIFWPEVLGALIFPAAESSADSKQEYCEPHHDIVAIKISLGDVFFCGLG
jgi:hypothetical protein